MLAHALLTVLAAPAKATAPTPGPTATTALIPLTRNEIRHLFVLLLHRAQATVELLLHWSRWRRHHQVTARASHYRQRANLE